MKHSLSTVLIVFTTAGIVLAQAPAPQTPPPPTTAKPTVTSKPRAAAPAAAGMAVQVTDKSGNPVEGVSVDVAGPVERTGITGADGTVTFRSMRAGTYRLRFERDGFVTLERELVTTRGAADVSVSLNAAPKAAPPAPVPTPPPAAPVATERPARAVEPRTLSIPDFVERNLIGSEPQKTTVIGCTDVGTARILQVKEPLNNQMRADADQLIYVVAGSGVVRIRDQDNKAGPGWYGLIPRGTTHSIRRDGRNPVITISVLMGPKCDAAVAAR